ncbi:uncharacterized protein [Nicotiana tomentosiformis]|uniref:uncharacterized protein n=1 Tax=Nicotiana tomentosiformis TaxID=4098 RepID=UPI00388C9DA0
MFDDEDMDGLMIPDNNALVISLLVHDTNVKRVLIDQDRSVNIILLRVVNEMKVNDKIIPKAWSLSGFDNLSIVTKREAMLATFEEGVIKDTKFQVIDADMTYNIILYYFAWSHSDMIGIPPEVMTHKLNEDPLHPPVKQKKRKQGAFKNQVIQDEIKTDPLDEEKTLFITDRGTYCYKVMPFGLKMLEPRIKDW